MRVDLLARIREHQDLTNVLVLTHNIDFVFIQNLVLAALRPCGSPSLTVFADANCARESYTLQGALLTSLGRRYRIVPVHQRPGSRFHPKAVFLSGRKKATLLVGSGNLTFGGWRENAEIWVEYDGVADPGEIAAFREMLTTLVERLPLNDGIQAELLEAFDSSTREWAAITAPPSGLLARLGDGPRLLDAMAAEWGESRADRLVVSTPYFDPEGDALLSLIAASAAGRTEVLIDPANSNLTTQAAKRWSGVRIQSVTVPRSGDEEERLGFVHAKFFALERPTEVVLFLGSANCSRAALLAGGSAGNSELLAACRLTRDQFQTQVLDILKQGAEPPKLLDPTELPPPREHQGRPTIVAARQEEGLLRIAYQGEWQVREARVDADAEPVFRVGDGVYECRAPADARVVRLVGSFDGQLYETPPHWIDHERVLASSAYRRSLHVALGTKARGGRWDFGDWEDILRLFCADLQYSNARRGSRASAGKTDEPPEKIFTAEELFGNGPVLRVGVPQAAPAASGAHASLQSILLRWFSDGIPGSQDAPGAELEPTDDDDDDDDDDNGVDRPEPVRLAGVSTPPPRDPSAQERRRLLAIVRQMSSLMCDQKYLDVRHPADLARDLKLASLLLRMARERRWLNREDVLRATFEIWSALFLSAGQDQVNGWLELRSRREAGGFRKYLQTPAVAAALFAWSLEIPDVAKTPEEARARLALALAVARCPALWVGENLGAIAAEVDRILKATTDHFDGDAITARWTALSRLALGLYRFERAVAASPVPELVRANPQSYVRPGDLIWQGPLGYCVMAEGAERSERVKAKVLPLQARSADSKLVRGDYLNSVLGLLALDQVRIVVGDELIVVLREFVQSIQSGARTAAQPPNRR